MPKLKGSLQSPYAEHGNKKGIEAPSAEIAEDPIVKAAIAHKEAAIQEKVDVSLTGSENPPTELKGSLKKDDPYEKASVSEEEIGNGSTFPFRFLGRPSLAYTTCSEPEKDRNKGCPQWYRCPIRNLGSTFIIFRDDKTGRIMHETCIQFIASGLAMNPNITIIPGADYFYSEGVKWAPHEDGTPVKAGPQEPKTHLVRTPIKNHLPRILSADIMRQYQTLRVRGEVR